MGCDQETSSPLFGSLCTTIIAVAIPFRIEADMNPESVHPYQLLSIDDRVKRVLQSTPLFDGHNDLPQQPRAIFHGRIHSNQKFDLEKGFERGMTDIPRLREGKQNPFDFVVLELTKVSNRRCWSTVLVDLRTMSPFCRELLNCRVL